MAVRSQQVGPGDRGGIEPVEIVVQIDAHRIAIMQGSREADQVLGEIGKDTPVDPGVHRSLWSRLS